MSVAVQPLQGDGSVSPGRDLQSILYSDSDFLCSSDLTGLLSVAQLHSQHLHRAFEYIVSRALIVHLRDT